MLKLVYDIEADNLLKEVTKVHCIVAEDYATGEQKKFIPKGFPMIADGSIEDGIDYLNSADVLIGHNIMDYDNKVLKKFYPHFKPKCSIDTLILCKLLYPDIKDIDFGLARKGKLPNNLIGRHSLEAWGHRVGEHKDNFGHDTDWKELTPDMLKYCCQDVRVNCVIYERMLIKQPPQQSIDTEMALHEICLEQRELGFPFNTKKADKLLGKLLVRKAELSQLIKADLYTTWIVKVGEVTPKRTISYKDVTRANTFKDCSYTKIKMIEFNPNSRAHIGKRLVEKYNWKPREYGKDGNPTVNEEVLTKLKFPVSSLLQEYLMIEKRLGQLAEGRQAWLSLVTPENKIHGTVDTIGAVTFRCSHKYPNLAQIPAVHSPYGVDMRGLFTVEEGEMLLGCDVSGLELRMLGHYLANYDGGEYGDIVVNGDIHSVNQKDAGLPTRDTAKTFIYAWLYGAGDEKIGSIVKGTRKHGKVLKEKFLKSRPAIKKLSEAVKRSAAKGFIKGLDGRRVPVRSQHAALNTLLQSAGAIVCKMWVVEFHEEMKRRGYTHGKQFKQAAFVHDELQIRFNVKDFPYTVEIVTDTKGKEKSVYHSELGDICVASIAKVGEKLGIRVPLTGEYSIGSNYAETH